MISSFGFSIEYETFHPILGEGFNLYVIGKTKDMIYYRFTPYGGPIAVAPKTMFFKQYRRVQ